VIGICGGYQMLGGRLKDPDHVEQGGEMEGLGLLPVVTVFEKQKTRTRVEGTVVSAAGPLKDLSGMKVEGYEVHMGATAPLSPIKKGSTIRWRIRCAAVLT
jgi:adenosylcobyric acid synthase